MTWGFKTISWIIEVYEIGKRVKKSESEGKKSGEGGIDYLFDWLVDLPRTGLEP